MNFWKYRTPQERAKDEAQAMQESRESQLGVLVIAAAIFFAPLVLAVWFGAMALMLAAFDLVKSQLG